MKLKSLLFALAAFAVATSGLACGPSLGSTYLGSGS